MSKLKWISFAVVVLTMLHTHGAHAQYVMKYDAGYYIPKLAVKHSTLNLIHFFPSVQVGLEHRVYRKTTMQYEVGWVFGINDNEEYANKRGHRFIGELRQYLEFTPRVPFYLAAEGYYHNIMFDRNRVIGHYGAGSGGSGQYAYYQYIQYKVRAEQSGGGLKFGMLLYPGRGNRTFFFDINGGLAVRDIRYTNVGMPSGNYNLLGAQRDYIFTPSEKSRVEIRPVLGIRMCFKIL